MSLSVSIKKKLGNFQLNVQFEGGNETLALLGASGCGKSMTLKCIAGIETPDEGRIVLDDRVFFDSEKKINLPPQKRQVGYLFQNYALFPHMTVAQNIASGIRKSKAERLKCVEEKISAFYLQGLEKKYPHQLSGGQQQRVALARILASEPELIMLDEPFSALDSYLKWQLEQELMSTLEAFSGTTLFVSHNRDEVYRLCQKVCVINKGKSEPLAAKHDLFQHPETLSAALLSGCKNFSRVRRVDTHRIEALDWGVKLITDRPIPENIQYIGVRMHHISITDQPGENVVAGRIQRMVEDVFSTILTLRPESSPGDTDYANIRVELPKERWMAMKDADRLYIYVAAKHILLLQ